MPANWMRFPSLIFVFFLALMWLSARIGARFHPHHQALSDDDRNNFGIILGASLTLLGLLIGFTFSMAITRYDQRKNLEEEEANAIGTEYVRAGLLPADSATKVRGLLVRYLDQRISHYQTRDVQKLRQIDGETSQLQNDMWTAVETPALAQPSPLSALAVSGMNDVLNSQGYTQAAWWNRIPAAAWALMAAIAVCSNLLLGYQVGLVSRRQVLLLVLPLILSISFFLIADIDSPRAGIIRIRPQNLISVAQSLHP